MNNSQDDQLERLLTDWANKTSAAPEDLESLRSAIDELRSTKDMASVVELAPLPMPRDRWQTVAGMTAAAAAVLIVALGLWYRPDPDGIAENEQKPLPQGLVQFPDPLSINTVSKDNQSRLWQEHHRVFGSELAWIAERDGQTEIGLANPSERANINDVIAVHLILWSRPEKNGKWKEVESFYVMAGREEVVQVASSREDATPIEIWIYPLDEKIVSIDLRYQSKMPGTLSIDESVLQQVDEYTKVCSIEKDGIEYRLYQRVSLIVNDEMG